MKMMIDGFRYEIEGYKLRFRLSKKKIVIIATLATLAVVLGMSLGHADPTVWPTFWMGGKTPTIT